MKATIDDQAGILTLINTFKVRDGRASDVARSLKTFTEDETRKMPGFVGASVHVSLDQTTVVNYVQWQTRQAFDAMFKSPAARAHMAELKTLVESVSPVFYEVVYVGAAGS